MRTARMVRWAATAALVLASGCNPDSPQNFRLKATLDGAAFDAAGVVATVQNSVINIAGAHQGQFMTLRVAIPATPGTVTFTGGFDQVNLAEIIAGSTTWSTIYGGSGTVTFTKTEGDEIAGTFSFTVARAPTQSGAANRVVTNGSFSAHF